MSLLGKILAVLNILGAGALIYFAMADYSKRHAWAYSKFRHELALNGLPLDAREQAANEEQIVNLLGEDANAPTLTAIFQQAGGNPVNTQIAEVDRLKGKLNGDLQAASGTRARTYALSSILLPLADQHDEREQLIACQALFVTDADLAKLKERYLKAFKEAVAEVTAKPGPGGPPPRSFEDAFRAAVRAQGGHRAEAITTMLVKHFQPADPTKTDIAKEFDTVLNEQLAQLDKDYNDRFDAALKGGEYAREAERKIQTGPNGTPAERTAVEMQKAAIARLLLGLCMVQADQAMTGAAAKARGTADFAIQLANTDAYKNNVKRMLVVCGLKAGIDAIAERSAIQRNLVAYLEGTVQQERGDFVADHAYYVELLRRQAALVKAEEALREESKRKLADQNEQVNRRQKEVNDHKEELKELEAKTADSMKELRKASEQLLNQRTEARDLIRKTQESEKTLRDLEAKIRELERKKP